MGKVLVIDISKCNGCYNCQIACKDEHVGNDWTPIAKPQPDTGQFWHEGDRHRAGHRAQGARPLHARHLPALRRGPLHPGLQE